MPPIRRPIRIVVDNGHVTLYGTVQNQMDKNIGRPACAAGLWSL